jgi:hypothetical protein
MVGRFAAVQQRIDASRQLPAKFDARLDRCQRTACKCGNFRNLYRLAAFEKFDRGPMVQGNPVYISGIEIRAHFRAHMLHDAVMILIERGWQKQILPGRDSGHIQEDDVAVIDEMHCYGTYRFRRCANERQPGQLCIAHELHRGGCDKHLWLDGFEGRSWLLQWVLEGSGPTIRHIDGTAMRSIRHLP